MANKARVYHVVLESALPGAPWAFAFGDYDKQAAKDEMEGLKESDRFHSPRGQRSRFKLISVQGAGRHVSQAEIDSSIATLNS